MATETNSDLPDQTAVRETGRASVIATGGILGAVAASSCCIVPLVLFSAGMGGAWLGNLSALTPYQPYLIAFTALMLGYGFYLVYWKPRQACAENGACRRPMPRRTVKTVLWLATVVVIAAGIFPYVAPSLLGVPS